MDSTLKRLLIAWVAGVVFALVLTERWRRMGVGSEPESPLVAASESEPPANSVERARRAGSGVANSVLAGMKADFNSMKSTAQRLSNQGSRTAAEDQTPSDTLAV